MRDWRGKLAADHFHPNDRGYAGMAEVMRRAVEHMRQTHGEEIIRETMIEAIRSRIEKVRDAA